MLFPNTVPILFNDHLSEFLKDDVIPMYRDFIEKQLHIMLLSRDQQVAISYYCKIILKKSLYIGEELDINEYHPIFEHMQKNIVF